MNNKDFKIQAGFRCEQAVYADVRDIAEAEKRSISEVFAAMVVAQVQRYKTGGWSAITSEGEE